MKPVINLNELTDYKERIEQPYGEKCAVISDKIGAKNLGYSVTILQPGFKVCPFHNHRIIEEMFLILEGEGTLRFGEKEYAIKEGDVIACPPGGYEVAHQIINTSNLELKYLCLSTKEPYDICEYPDSKKVLSFVGEHHKKEFMHIARKEDAVDYYDGEK